LATPASNNFNHSDAMEFHSGLHYLIWLAQNTSILNSNENPEQLH